MSPITAPRVEGTVRVRGDRKLGFAEFGPHDGTPVVWCHGTPGARRQIPEPARLAAIETGVRIVGIDRPGVGLSTSHLYPSVLDFALDLEIVADQLGLGRFATVGLSGGGPYALAAAHALGDRVPSVGVLGGVAPTRGLHAARGGLMSLAMPWAPVLPLVRGPLGTILGSVVRAARPVGSPALDLYARFSPEGDRELLGRPEFKAMFLDDIIGGSKRGMRAPVFDVILFTRHWGFEVSDLAVPVTWWHGDSDNIVPLAHAEHIVPRFPQAELRIRPGESHLGGLGAAEEVLETILAGWAPPPSAAAS
jgi:pimeloyl-ACP methyl ester carboxylesterase